jgi:hypothetical protein
MIIMKARKIFISFFGFEDAAAQARMAGFQVVGKAYRAGQYMIFGRQL